GDRHRLETEAARGAILDLQPDRLDALYESQWTCMATFRALPPLAKHYVMRLLFIESVPLGARFVSIPGGLQPEPNAQRRRDCKGPSQPTQPPCSPSRRASLLSPRPCGPSPIVRMRSI
ncbi:hypothetical protein EBT31_20505, partial [bacterium]|nr:hypothetical protein [bacterium]